MNFTQCSNYYHISLANSSKRGPCNSLEVHSKGLLLMASSSPFYNWKWWQNFGSRVHQEAQPTRVQRLKQVLKGKSRDSEKKKIHLGEMIPSPTCCDKDSHYVAQAGFQLLASNDTLMSALGPCVLTHNFTASQSYFLRHSYPVEKGSEESGDHSRYPVPCFFWPTSSRIGSSLEMGVGGEQVFKNKARQERKSACEGSYQ